MYHQFKELAEVDITKQAMEVGPTLHYFMGGIVVDSDSQMTTVDGLFACGECAGGMHGANRLGGNSLSDLLVFGWLAGKGAKAYLDELGDTACEPDPDEVMAGIRSATACLNREDGPNPYLLHGELQDIMHAGVNIVRDEEGLTDALAKLMELKKKIAVVKAHGASQYNPGWHEALSLEPMMLISEAVTRSAIARKESRGAHSRLDYEGERPEWGKINHHVTKGPDGEMVITAVERGEDPAELAAIARATLDELDGGIHA
jgi:succinate dehydrogenase / fumarate reductase flavoprotein subunit